MQEGNPVIIRCNNSLQNCHQTKGQFATKRPKRKQLYDTNHENTSTCRCKTRLHLIYKAVMSNLEFSVVLTPM